jgi:hypothetical protein
VLAPQRALAGSHTKPRRITAGLPAEIASVSAERWSQWHTPNWFFGQLTSGFSCQWSAGGSPVVTGRHRVRHPISSPCPRQTSQQPPRLLQVAHFFGQESVDKLPNLSKDVDDWPLFGIHLDGYRPGCLQGAEALARESRRRPRGGTLGGIGEKSCPDLQVGIGSYQISIAVTGLVRGVAPALGVQAGMSGSGPRRAVAADVDGTGIMCDWTPVRNWLIGIAAAIVSAAAIALGAAAVNPNVWYSWLAPVGMLAAAAVTGATVLVCGAAISALDTFCACAGSKCAGPCGNLRRTLEAARIVLGIQATACLTAALTAWIPGIGSAPIWVIIGALLIQLALIIAAIAFMSQLASCQSTPPPTPPSPPTPPTPPNPAGPIG